MKRKAIISLILILSIILSVSACEKKQKKIVLTSDVKQEATMQENEIKKFIADGTDFLNNGKYDDAKSTFEKAISMDKANKGAYIEIKNKYMEKQRIDDADSLLPEGSVTDDYYIRNKDDSLVTYNIAPNVEISVCGWTINLDTIDKQKISYDKFKALDKGYGPIYKKLLCYIYLENNEIVKIEEQFRP